MNHDYLIINVTTTKIENYYIGIYKGVFPKGSFFIVVFYLFHDTLFKVSLPDVAFIRITSYAMTLNSSAIVVIFHGAYIR